MKGIWKVREVSGPATARYQVYRTLDRMKPEDPDNVEVGAYDGCLEAARLKAAEANEADGLRHWIAHYLVREYGAVHGFKTCVVAKTIRDAAKRAELFAFEKHVLMDSRIFITDVAIAYPEAGTMVDEEKEDILADPEDWPA